MNEIALPAGTTQVSVKEIPALIALAIHPRVSTGRVVSYLAKHVPSTARNSGHGAPLTDAERAVLDDIWKDLPAMEQGVPEADWPRYAMAFDSAKKKPKWKPVPVWRNDALNADILRINAEEEHRRALRNAIARGELIALNHARLPVSMAYPDAIVMVGALRQYAALFEVGVGVAEPSAAVVVASKQVSDNEWRGLARTEALKIIKRQAARDLFPSQISIADEIADDFRKRVPPVVGAEGKPLSGASIKRRALNGISSGIKKQQSTTMRRGK